MIERGPPPEVSARRLDLLRGGYTPLPAFGKKPSVLNWSELIAVTPGQLKLWGKTWPGAVNTGILTREVPTLDVDILNPEAAEAVEALVRERFEERGHLMVRIGKPPKRAYLFRTDASFKKISISFAGTEEKLELLCDGQQVIVDGIHPDTQKPYAWFGGQPWQVKRDDLPLITATEASELMEAIAELLVKDFNYVRVAGRKKQNGSANDSGGAEDWQYLVDRILAGQDLHDNLRDLAAKLVRSGMSGGAVVNMLRGFMNSSSAPHDDRWQERYDDIPRLVDGAEELINDPTSAPGLSNESDLDRLNRKHAVLPIGGKTRVVTFGELPEFPGRTTIVMTQTIPDFKALQNRYRHAYKNEKGEPGKIPMGTYWISNPKRRQYDGGMAFMPNQDLDVGPKLNLWRGFGVKPVKGDCSKFLGFACDIVCSGIDEHFDYLIKREAFILQKRTRSEVALALQTREEGAGKGFYERAMSRLLGNHAMQLGNADHITGKFNPHLETLLRVTADEALFVGDPRHRNALFGLITEPTLTIEPKGCGVYAAPNYLNVTILSNSVHFIPISTTARRFFVPTMSSARVGDHAYFTSLQAELDNGGHEALLHYLLHEVDLTGFNVRRVPQTDALRHQRDQSLSPLDAWWCELLESGTLRGSDPGYPNRAVSNSYVRIVQVETVSYGTTTSKQPRTFTQLGLFDQARQIEPRLRNYTSDHALGRFLTEKGCDNTKKVARRAGWTFPPLSECRAAWEALYPGWTWRNPDLTEWQPETDEFKDFADLKHLDAEDVLDALRRKEARKQGEDDQV